MAFDKQLIEAKLAYGTLLPEDLPAIAWDALEAGYDGPTLCRLAGLEKPSGWETDRLMPALIDELSLRPLSKQQGAVALAQYWAKRIIEEGSDPLDELPRFYSLYYRSGYPRELAGIGGLDDEFYWRDKSEVRADALAELRWLAELDLEAEADKRKGPLAKVRHEALKAHLSTPITVKKPSWSQKLIRLWRR